MLMYECECELNCRNWEKRFYFRKFSKHDLSIRSFLEIVIRKSHSIFCIIKVSLCNLLETEHILGVEKIFIDNRVKTAH